MALAERRQNATPVLFAKRIRVRILRAIALKSRSPSKKQNQRVGVSMCDVTGNARRRLPTGVSLPPRRISRPYVARLYPNILKDDMLSERSADVSAARVSTKKCQRLQQPLERTGRDSVLLN